MTELELTKGIVTFGVEMGKEGENIDEQTFSVEFHSLNDLIALLSEDKAKMYANLRGAKNVFVDSVNFIAENEAEGLRVETILMEDSSVVELLH